MKIYENTHITFTSDTFQNTLLIVTFKCTSEHYMTVWVPSVKEEYNCLTAIKAE